MCKERPPIVPTQLVEGLVEISTSLSWWQTSGKLVDALRLHHAGRCLYALYKEPRGARYTGMVVAKQIVEQQFEIRAPVCAMPHNGLAVFNTM